MQTNGEIAIDWLHEMWAYQYPKCVVTMFILWLVFVCTKIECIVDFGWVLNHAIVGIFLVVQYSKSVQTAGWVSLGLLLLWFLRLGGFIFKNRLLTGYKDERYKALEKNSKIKSQNLYFLFQYQLQAVMATLTATPLFFVFRNYTVEHNNGLTRWSFIVGGSLILIGIIFEGVADYQLQSYKDSKKKQRVKDVDTSAQEKIAQGQKPKINLEDVNINTDAAKNGKKSTDEYQNLLAEGDYENQKNGTASAKPQAYPESKDEFPNIFHYGLWNKSRHPNLFFELVTWVGFAVQGFSQLPIGLIGIFGPIMLWAIMRYLTVPLTEAHMARTRPNWGEFLKKSNMFLPF